MKETRQLIISALELLDCYNSDEMPKLGKAKQELEEALKYLSNTRKKTPDR